MKKIDDVLPRLNDKPFRKFYRLVTRNMVNPTNERCLFTVIIPPEVMYINTLNGICSTNLSNLVICAGLATSLVLDGYLRLKNKTHVFPDDIKELPVGVRSNFYNSIGRRALSLSGLTTFYSELWKDCAKFNCGETDSLISGRKLKGFGDGYSRENALRASDDREQALIEIDALTALSFDLIEEELVQIYQIFFPVLYMYDRQRSFNRSSKLREAYRFFKKRGW